MCDSLRPVCAVVQEAHKFLIEAFLIFLFSLQIFSKFGNKYFIVTGDLSTYHLRINDFYTIFFTINLHQNEERFASAEFVHCSLSRNAKNRVHCCCIEENIAGDFHVVQEKQANEIPFKRNFSLPRI